MYSIFWVYRCLPLDINYRHSTAIADDVQTVHSYSMNPFERLRKAIDNVNINYEFPEEQNYQEFKSSDHQDRLASPQKTIVSVSNNDEIQKVKELWENQQLASVRQMTELSAKIEQLEKHLKRSETVIQNQMNQIVELEQQNQQLKANLNQQYASVVQYDEKERKYKEEIYRINVTINQLAVDIQAERNAKKQLNKEVDTLKAKLRSQQQELADYKENWEKQKLKLQSQLEERIEMFEYQVKKSSEDRKQFRLTLTNSQESYAKSLDACREEITSLKQQLSESKKSIEIQIIRKKNCQEALEREKGQLNRLKTANAQLSEELKILREKYEQSQKREEALQRNLSSLGSELAEEKKNLKVKVVQVRDETVNLQLQMYKRQCKQLLQEKIIMKSLTNYPSDKAFEPEFRLTNSHQSNSI